MKEAHAAAVLASNPDEEMADWRTVCGRTARTVQKGGEHFPTPIISELL